MNNKSATANLLNAMSPAEHRQMRAAYEVWRWLRETERLPIVQKMFREPDVRGQREQFVMLDELAAKGG